MSRLSAMEFDRCVTVRYETDKALASKVYEASGLYAKFENYNGAELGTSFLGSTPTNWTVFNFCSRRGNTTAEQIDPSCCYLSINLSRYTRLKQNITLKFSFNIICGRKRYWF